MQLPPISERLARTSRRLSFRWHPVEVFGAPPQPRHGHAATSLWSSLATSSPADGPGFTGPTSAAGGAWPDIARRTMVVHGGQGMRGRFFADIHVMTLTRVSLSAVAPGAPPGAVRYVACWSSPLLVPSPSTDAALAAQAAVAAGAGVLPPHGGKGAAGWMGSFAPNGSCESESHRRAGEGEQATSDDERVARLRSLVGPSPRSKHSASYLPSWPGARLPDALTSPTFDGAGPSLGAPLGSADVAALQHSPNAVPGAILVFGGHDGGPTQYRHDREDEQTLAARLSRHAAAAYAQQHGVRRSSAEAVAAGAAVASLSCGWLAPNAATPRDYVRLTQAGRVGLDLTPADVMAFRRRAVRQLPSPAQPLQGGRGRAAEPPSAAAGHPSGSTAGSGAATFKAALRAALHGAQEPDRDDVDDDDSADEGDDEVQAELLRAIIGDPSIHALLRDSGLFPELPGGNAVGPMGGAMELEEEEQEEAVDDDDVEGGFDDELFDEEGADDEDDLGEDDDDEDDDDDEGAPEEEEPDAERGILSDANLHVLRLVLAPALHHMKPGARYGGSGSGGATQASSLPPSAVQLACDLRGPVTATSPFLPADAASLGPLCPPSLARLALRTLHAEEPPCAPPRGSDALSDYLALRDLLVEVPPAEQGLAAVGQGRDPDPELLRQAVEGPGAQATGARRRVARHLLIRDALRVHALRIVPVAWWEQPQGRYVAPWLGGEPQPAVPPSTVVRDLGRALVGVRNGDYDVILQRDTPPALTLTVQPSPSVSVRTFRWLLAARSLVFASFLRPADAGQPAWRESQSSALVLPHAPEAVDGLDEATLRSLLHYLATDCLPRETCARTPDALMRLFTAAQRFGVPRLALLAEGELLRTPGLVHGRNLPALLPFIEAFCPPSAQQQPHTVTQEAGGGQSPPDAGPAGTGQPPGLILRTAVLAAKGSFDSDARRAGGAGDQQPAGPSESPQAGA